MPRRRPRSLSLSLASSCSSPASRPEPWPRAVPPAHAAAPGQRPSLPGRDRDHHATSCSRVGVVEHSQQEHYNQPRSPNNLSTRPAPATPAQVADLVATPNGPPGPPTARPKTSSERGRVFRLRQKQYEKDLAVHVRVLRRQVAQLRHSRDLLLRDEHDLSSHSESLVELVRELHTVLRRGLEPNVDNADRRQDPHRSGSMRQTIQEQISAAKHKESFLRRVLEPDVRHGDLVGVEAVIDQLRRYTASYSKFEIEIGAIQAINSVERTPIVVSNLKLHVRFSRESFPAMFPRALEQIPELAANFLNRDFSLDCAARFQFADSGKINACILEINFVEALVKEFGSARDVAALMQFLAATRDWTLVDARVAACW